MDSNRNILVTGGTITYVAGHQYHNGPGASSSPSGFQLLCERVAANALHDSGEVSDQPKCHPGTRVAILNELDSWAAALVHKFPVKWLHGPAGAGKSAIQRTIAQTLQEQGLLLASFFFFRSDPTRNSASQFVSTIVYQLALAIPQTRSYIEAIIQKKPFIFSSSILRQVQTLIIDPICFVHRESPFGVGSYPKIILVDGLDECNDPDKQCEILQALCFCIQKLPIPIAVLVASRPEHHIRGVFDIGDLNKLSSRIGLDESYNPDADIKKYLRERFNAILERHPMKSSLGLRWPSSSVLDKLVAKSSGQFIYASTVEKFINSPRHNPSRRLDIILGALDAGDAKPFQQLDILYSTIFSSVVEDLPTTMRILGALLVPYVEFQLFSSDENFRSPAHIERLFKLEAGDVRRLLYDLESLVNIQKNDENVRFFHASLSDYLFDRSRSGQFWIDTESMYADLVAHQILRLTEWPAIHNVFMNNVNFFLSRAAVTPGLQSAIMNCDLKKLTAPRNVNSRSSTPYPFGLNYVAPTLFDAAIENSQFVNARELFAAKLSSYQRLLEGIIQVYLREFRLKAFLVLVCLPMQWVGRKRNQMFPLRPTDMETERARGFKLVDSVEAPPVMPYIADIINDPNKKCFVDGNQYADIMVYGLQNLRSHSGTTNDELISTASQAFSLLLPKCSLREDLIRSIKEILQECPDMIIEAFNEAIATYLSRTEFEPIVQSSEAEENKAAVPRSGKEADPMLSSKLRSIGELGSGWCKCIVM